MEIEERFWSKVAIAGPDECWEWTASHNRWGYGLFSLARKTVKATRLAWELWNAEPVPPGLQVLHRCDNPPCVNPEHLWVGTHTDNMTDKARKGRHHEQRKTHCPQGHPYSGDNLFRGSEGERKCRACDANRASEYRREHR